MAGTQAVMCATMLKEKLEASAQNLRILDVTWYSDKDGSSEYQKNHIPQALHFNIFRNAEHSDLFPRNIPSESSFQEYVRSLGINQDDHIIVYETIPDKGGFFVGSRAWWMFKLFGQEKVSVLNGGFAKWLELGFPTTAEVPSFQPGNWTAKYNTRWRTEFENMKRNLSSKQYQVLDTRPADGFKGKSDDPKSGHYPGANSIPFADKLLDKSKNTIHSKDALRTLFSEIGVENDKPIVTMCNSGMSSCSLTLALHSIGITDVSLYHGGFTEWKNKADPAEIERN